MPFEPTEIVPLGRTGLRVSRLGFGGASIGGLFAPVSDDEAAATLEHAWDLGIRYFDTAPLYGYGLSERRVGAALRGRDRDDFVLSTKVGRLLRPADAIPPDADIDRQALDGRDDAYYGGSQPFRPVFDYRRTASAGRSRRASSASAWSASTSRTSTTRTITGRRPSTARTRRSTGCARRGSSGRSAPG